MAAIPRARKTTAATPVDSPPAAPVRVDASPVQADPPAPAAAVEEIELKLAIDPVQAARLGRLPLVRNSTAGRPVRRKLHSVYYDTPERDLLRSGAALRLRRDGPRWVQTLKSGGGVEAGLHRRNEIESRVPAQLLDYRALAESGHGEVFADPARRARLVPVFVTDFVRTIRHVEPTPGTRIEIAFDQGSITSGDATAPISELELELKSGLAEGILDFAAALVQQAPALRLEARTKAERGYALAEHKPDAPVKAIPPALTPALTPAQALRAIVFGCVAQIQANEAGVIAGQDVEYLHQARVGMRRLRSALTVFRPGFPRAAFAEVVGELRWLDGTLGPARDWDVFDTETLPRIALAFAHHPGLQALAAHARQLRVQANRSAAEALGSARYTLLLLRMLGVFHRQPWARVADEAASAARAQSLEAFARDVLSRRHRKVTRTGRRLVNADSQHESDHAELHRLRIEIKKLRYAAEFFSSLYERKVKAYTSALAGLQELLGGLNDAATVERLCAALRTAVDTGAGEEAIGIIRGWAAASARTHLEQLPQAWKRFRDVDVFW